jgi:hypothetical protein
MCHTIRFKLFLLVLACIAQPACLPGQPASLSGRVIDAETGQAVAGAAIALLEAPSFLVRTDEQGRYTFPDVQQGDYTIRVFKGGYEPCDVTGITLQPGVQDKPVEILLSATSNVVQMEKFEVSAEVDLYRETTRNWVVLNK